MRTFLVEVAHVACYLHLVCLLEILFVHEVVCYLRWQSVERHTLQMGSKLHVARYLHHLLQREHHLHCRAQLRTLCGHIAVQTLVASIHSLRLSVEAPQISHSLPYGLQIFRVLCLLVVYHGLLQSLRQIHTVYSSHARQYVATYEHIREVHGLLMYQLSQSEQCLVARYVV